MRRRRTRVSPLTRMAVAVVCAVMAGALLPDARGAAPATFAERVRSLSEPAGYFDTDNLISNESSYQHVVPALEAQGVSGGVYIGVGPDQNFSYIAKIRPDVAYLVDLRRDNLLLHLLFKALFQLAPTRTEYLSLLTGRAPPPERIRARDLALPEVLQWVDQAAVTHRGTLRTQVERQLATFGVALEPADLETIARFHGEFISEGLDLQFRSHGRQPNSFYPTLRQLLMATDRQGRRWSYLDREPAYQFVRALHARDAIIPVVGDLSGGHAVRAIAAEMTRDGRGLSAIYVSNVEDYLFRRRRFAAWVDNLVQLPRAPHAVVIRSVFGGGPSVSEIQRVEELVAGVAAGRYRSYPDLVYRAR